MGWKALSKMVQALIITGIVLVVIAGIGIGFGILIKSTYLKINSCCKFLLLRDFEVTTVFTTLE